MATPVFHLLGMPHTATSSAWSCCAYSQKVRKFAKMFAGSPIVHYGNEGSDVPWATEHVEIYSDDERQGYFGKDDHSKPYNPSFDPALPAWSEWNMRAIAALKSRVAVGDFILTLCGTAHQPIGDAFPGSYSGTAQSAMMVEYGIGYYGTFSQYRVFESQTHREWVHGRADRRTADWGDCVIPNYFDMDEFPYRNHPRRAGYVFLGRIQESKGYRVAIEVTKAVGSTLLLVGQGDPGELPHRVRLHGPANPTVRAELLAGAIASFAPTTYREPFGGVAVEAQLMGCPAITTDFGGFVETVQPWWRCNSHKEFCKAARFATFMHEHDRTDLRTRAEGRYSLEAVKPQYERYFDRLSDRFPGKGGWYAT